MHIIYKAARTVYAPIFSDHTRMHPLPNRRAAVGAVLHPLRADAVRALMAARHGEVRLRMHHTHDARRLAADGGLRNVVAARDVAGGWVGVWDWDRRG